MVPRACLAEAEGEGGAVDSRVPQTNARARRRRRTEGRQRPAEGLEGEKYDVVVERTGEGAFFRVNTETFDVILLDLALPGPRRPRDPRGAARSAG